MLPRLSIFDLDGTVIDSSHRRSYNPDGTLNIDEWRRNSTRDNIMRDKLLPLASIMRELIHAKEMVAICTARVLRDADYDFLSLHGIMPRIIISRTEGDTTPDAEFKKRELAHSFTTRWLCTATMWEDMPEIRKAVNTLGVLPLDPHFINGTI